MRFKTLEDWTVVFFIIILLVSSISAIKYFDSQEVFEAKILQQNQNGKFSIDLQIKNKLNENLNFEIETIYKRGNLVVNSENLKCKTTCDINLEIDKIFFDKYDVVVKTFYKGRGYKKKLTFKFDKQQAKFQAKVLNKITWESEDLIIPVEIKSSNPTELTKYILDIFPTNRPEIRSSFTYECLDECFDDFIISSSILLGEYTINIYSQNDVLKLKFNVISKLLDGTILNPPLATIPKEKEKPEITTGNKTIKIISQNKTDVEIATQELGIIETIVNPESAKLVRNYSSLNQEINLDENKIEELETQIELSGKIIAIDIGGNQIEVDNISEILENKKYIGIIEPQTSSTERQEQIKLKPIIQNVNTLTEIDKIETRELSITEKLIQKDKTALDFTKSSFGAKNIDPVSKQIIGKTEQILEQSEVGFQRTNLTLEKLQNKETNKLIPGIYKKEERTLYADGSEETKEIYFAYGLLTVNTLKPLYKKDELVEMKIVVLDAGGFLVDNAKINLEITKPSGESLVLSTTDNQISQSENPGVYLTEIYANELGNYNLYAQVEQYDMIVDVQTYFNVVEFEKILFDIVRDVPATIDPWLGPFNNTFKITPHRNLENEIYEFTEVFSSDFTNISTNANLINSQNNLTYLTWTNLTGIQNNLFYSAQVPKVTPYLYELGKSFVEFNSNETFFENRPWLFAIDPVAKVCDARGGPGDCYCGSRCAGGGGESAPGDGTIDACADTNVQYEWVNELTVENTDGSPYFGTGNTVTACISVRVDTSERVSMFYMDHSANGGTTFGNGGSGAQNPSSGVTRIYESNNLHSDDKDHTYCMDFVLNNYIGTHYIRGKQVYQGGTNQVCAGGGGYKDQDDISFEVLDKVGPSFLSWTLNNGTTSGNNLNVIRGASIDIIANWDRPLQSGQFRHNSIGNIFYNVDSYSNNQTTYTHDTSNITLYPNVGEITTNRASANDFYFNLVTAQNPTNQKFKIFGTTAITDSILTPYISYLGTLSEFSCLIMDKNIGIPYQNVNVEFKVDGSSIGSVLTNASGWAKTTYTPGFIGLFNLTCEISDELPKYFIASSNNIQSKILDVKQAGADINPPQVYNILALSPLQIPVGVPFNSNASFSDDISLKEIFISVKTPSGSINTIKHTSFDNVIGHWNFDKINATHMEDFGPNNLDAEFMNSPGVGTVLGIRGSYGIFDGTNQHAKVAYDGNMSTDEFTFSLWAKVTGGLGTFRSPITFRSSSPQSGFSVYADNSNMWSFWIGTGSIWRQLSQNSVVNNVWIHLAGTYDGTQMRFYQNGIQVGSPITTSFSKNTFRDLNIGCGGDTGGSFCFNGHIDDIWLFNKSLSANEIKNLFNRNSILNETYTFNFPGTSDFGFYEYFYSAYDITDNLGFSAKYNFEAKGIDGYLDTKMTKSIYKQGQTINFNSPEFISDLTTGTITELGDTGSIFYDFTTNLQGWTSGVLSGSTNNWARGNDNDCPNRPCIATTINGNVGTNSNQYIESPTLNFLGRSNTRLTYHMAFNSDTGTSDRAYVEGFDGSAWSFILFQDSISGGNNWAPGTVSYTAPDLNGIENSKIRFRLTSDGSSSYEGWRVDDINISFNPRVEWDNDWVTYNTLFGVSEDISAIEFSVNITGYSNTGSSSLGNNNPDLKIEFFDGTSFNHTQKCNLNSGLTYPTTCSFTLASQSTYLNAWKTPSNRQVRIRAVGMDTGDSISYKNVERKYAKPSLIKNYGILPIDAFLVHNLVNSSGDVVRNLLTKPVSIPVDSYIDLSIDSLLLAPPLDLGEYTLHTAIKDALGNIIVSESDGSSLENSLPLNMSGIKIDVITPVSNNLYFKSLTFKITPDVSQIASGGWCGYSLDGAVNQSLTQSGPDFEKSITPANGMHTIIFYCDDAVGEIVPSELVNFEIYSDFEFDAKINKTITSIGTDLYLVNISITNLENKTLRKSVIDFIPSQYVDSSYSSLSNATTSVTGKFTGKLIRWDLKLNNTETRYLSYELSGSSDYYFMDLFKVILD